MVNGEINIYNSIGVCIRNPGWDSELVTSNLVFSWSRCLWYFRIATLRTPVLKIKWDFRATFDKMERRPTKMCFSCMSREIEVFYLTRLSVAEVIQRRWQTNGT